MRVGVSLCAMGCWLCTMVPWGLASMGAEEETEVAELLIALLKTGCSVVAEYQPLINDPSKGNKGFTEEFVGRAIAEKFKAETSIDLSAPNGLPARGLLSTLLDSQRAVVFDAQPAIDKPGIGFKGFLPAVFARKAAEKFTAQTGVTIKMTEMEARFPRSKPDDFETEVLRMFVDPRHPRGQRYARVTASNGKSVLRLMYPEYADAMRPLCDRDPRREPTAMGRAGQAIEGGGRACAIRVGMARRTRQ